MNRNVDWGSVWSSAVYEWERQQQGNDIVFSLTSDGGIDWSIYGFNFCYIDVTVLSPDKKTKGKTIEVNIEEEIVLIGDKDTAPLFELAQKWATSQGFVEKNKGFVRREVFMKYTANPSLSSDEIGVDLAKKIKDELELTLTELIDEVDELAAKFAAALGV